MIATPTVQALMKPEVVSILATIGIELYHLPPLTESVSVVVVMAHIVDGPTIAPGLELICIGVITLQSPVIV